MQKVTFQYRKRFGQMIEETFEFDDTATELEIHRERCDWGEIQRKKEYEEMKQQGYGKDDDY